jgi:hypothetical protein
MKPTSPPVQLFQNSFSKGKALELEAHQSIPSTFEVKAEGEQ